MTDPLLFLYASAELILALHISLSNFVVILVYLRSKHIRTPTNAYIFSLAMTDFLAGALGIPFTVISVLTKWPNSYYACLAIHLILCVLCTVSTLHLLAMAVDKYLTICLKRFDHQRTSSTSSVRKTRAHFLIVSAWLLGAAIAGLPMVDGFGFASRTIGNFQGECHFTVVVDYRYLVFVIFFGTIILPSVIIAFCYMAIYGHIRREERQIKCLLRASERQRRINARRKLIRILLILVLTYAICWYPLYLINTADLFLPQQFHAGRTITLAAVVLSHLNCALNPMIYAYGVPGFKHSLRRFLPVKAATNCSQGQSPYTGAAVPMPKSPFIGYNGMPMGIKRQVAPGTMAQMSGNGHGVNGRSGPPMGKFTRAVSTVNAAPAALNADSANSPLITGKKSTQSLLETRRQQFQHRHHNHHGEEDEKMSQTSKCPNSSCQLQNSTTTETEEQRSESGMASGYYEGEENGQMEEQKNSTTATTYSMEDEEEEKRRMRKRTKTLEDEKMQQNRPKRSSIASKMSAWSVRIFNGQWLVRSSPKLADEEIAQQKLGLIVDENNHQNNGKTILTENGRKGTEEEEENASYSTMANGSCECE